ncbi:hypothetical protein CHARACLAT_030740 [Characodon lateralis]|uniref:Uncharacterized protein n=1 Tax=Characodon lateralis TaxID=208331 RepID=A0ABU7EY83_9TELE|nr:hypothetical protein [Characodon lateralis]
MLSLQSRGRGGGGRVKHTDPERDPRFQSPPTPECFLQTSCMWNRPGDRGGDWNTAEPAPGSPQLLGTNKVRSSSTTLKGTFHHLCTADGSVSHKDRTLKDFTLKQLMLL